MKFNPISIFFSFVIMIFLIALYKDHLLEKKIERLIEQCIKDGKKEYECESVVRRPSNSYIPIFPVIAR